MHGLSSCYGARSAELRSKVDEYEQDAKQSIQMAVYPMAIKGPQFECPVRLVNQLHAYADGFGSDPNAPHRAVTRLDRVDSAC